MKFHQNCGKNVKLSHSNLSAERTGDSYDNAVVYSSRPLNIGEIFQLKVKAVESKWAGSLRIGLTTLNPNDPENCIFRAATEMLSPKACVDSYWLWLGNTLHHNRTERKLTLSLHSLVVNDVVGIQVRPNGDFHIYQHGIHVAKVASKLPVDKKLYVIFDVYGKTKKVCYDTKVGTLQHQCRKKILELVKPTVIDELPLPKSIRGFLKDF